MDEKYFVQMLSNQIHPKIAKHLIYLLQIQAITYMFGIGIRKKNMRDLKNLEIKKYKDLLKEKYLRSLRRHLYQKGYVCTKLDGLIH